MFEDALYCRIHPAIGIARVGNSPNEYFIGPEIPGKTEPPIGGYKDRGQPEIGIPPRVKRQAARFRIYAYDADHRVLGELTAEHADIAWTVHLVNSKAEGDRFAGLVGEELPLGERRPREFWRNRTLDDRSSLIINPGPRTLQGPNQTAEFENGKFRGFLVPLGTMRTDDTARLLVLGGFGKSGSSNPAAKIGNYANNDLWYDDVSDGPVTATVTLKSGRNLRVEPSWVVVAPPDFAPAIQNIVTLYDAILDMAQRHGLPLAAVAPTRPSFTHDIGPIFARLASLQWVQQGARGTNGATAEFSDLARLADNSRTKTVADYRQDIFSRFRNPSLDPRSDDAKKQATSEFLPALSGDTGDAQNGLPRTWLTVTRSQYELLEKWRDGQFENDWQGQFPAPSAVVTPEGLDRAALEACAGGAFYPGIEGGWLLRNPSAYTAAFRLSHDRLKPGDLTRHMACPWQADFFECMWHWWPAQRPDEVLTEEAIRHIREIDERLQHLDPESREARSLRADRNALWTEREAWTRGLPGESYDGDLAMVARWAQHGFIIATNQDGTPSEVAGALAPSETERGKYEGLDWPDYFHILMNIERHPDFFPKAMELARAFFAAADYDADENYLPFKYTPEKFDERLQKIYDEFVIAMNEPSRMDTGIISYPVVVRREGDADITKMIDFDVKPFSNKAIIERLKQRAPFNLTDGAWLQRIQSAGPVDDVRAHLFSVWDDEAGNGRADQNHCNVYETLLRSQNVYMPPVTSRKFVEQGLLPAAFIQPVFQLAVSLFPDEFFPEILGMTLYLEWEATPTLMPIVRLYQGRGIDPHFYSLHVAIDNITAGHGFLAQEAIKLYLQNVEEQGGATEDIWSRIWNGYVTWATAGDLGQDLLELTMIMDHKQIDISYPMTIVAATILQPGGLLKRLRAAAQGIATEDALSTAVVAQFRPAVQEELRHAVGEQPSQALLYAIVDQLNLVIQSGSSLYDEQRFAGIALSDEVKRLLQTNPTGEKLVRLNRLLLRDGYLGVIDGIPQTEPLLFPDYRAYFRRRFVELIKRKARAAKPLHRGVTVAGKNLAELFDSPEDIPQALVDAGLIDVQHPRSSRFFDFLNFGGPMYKIFTDDEKGIILDWIESLREPDEPKPGPIVSPEEWAARVLQFIKDNAEAAAATQRHDSYTLNDENGQPRTLRSWFADPRGLMAALVRNRWAIPHDAANSRFYREFAVGPMRFMGPNVAEMIREWIDTGAVLTTAPAAGVVAAPVGAVSQPLAAFVSPAMTEESVAVTDEAAEAGPFGPPAVAAVSAQGPLRRDFAAKRKLIGMGAVH